MDNELIMINKDLETSRESDNWCDYEKPIYYISDLHLDYKLRKNKICKLFVNQYLHRVVQQLKNSVKNSCGAIIVFVGDITNDFDLYKNFFKIYKKYFVNQTFVILGNHELWDSDLNRHCCSIEEIIDQYRRFLSKIDIQLLENELYLPNSKPKIYTEEKLCSINKDTLYKKILKNGFAIFGGIGYAGLNNTMNSNNGMYKTNLINRDQEIERSQRVDYIHHKLTEIAKNKKVFFITHMPKECWSNQEYNKNWVYISGHTHKNIYIEKPYTLYADNQLGYDSENYVFKCTGASETYNIFQDYKDGIYQIKRDQYRNFYSGIRDSIEFNKDFQRLYMLKKNGYYCFLLTIKNRDEIYILEGGHVRKTGKNNINYFYEHMDNYANSIKLFLNDYITYQKEVSKRVKKIGGFGRIHGAIVDIDFYNHLYINPVDAKITPYYATSDVDKYVYDNIPSLLKYRCPKSYKIFNELNYNNKQILLKSDSLALNGKCKYVPERDIYKLSLKIKKLQSCTDFNVITIWNDALAENLSKENGAIIVSNILNMKENH